MDNLMRWIGQIFAYLQAPDWKSVDWALVISILALIVSFYTANLYRKEIFILKKQLQVEQNRFEQELKEKSKRVLDISISQIKVYGGGNEQPLKKMGTWLLITNRSSEQVLLSRVAVKLRFRKEYMRRDENFLKFTYGFLLAKLQNLSISFLMYHHHLKRSYSFMPSIDNSLEIPLNFYLLDWESKKPIYFSPEQKYRFPEPGKKEIWFLLGNFTKDDAEQWFQANLCLEEIALRFETDQGMIVVEKEIDAYLSIDSDEMDNWSNFTFDFEIVPTTIFFG
ncbi:MAG: hypothetical protein ACOYZ8_11230 [Chloroflexota bacterium]